MEQVLYQNKRFLTQNEYLRKRFGRKTIKLSLNTGCTCPNRDGSKGKGGCTYCSASLSGDFSGQPDISVTAQLNQQVSLLSAKWNGCLYIPYFQAGTNTYGNFERLTAGFEEALKFTDTVGIAIATRPDCLDDRMLVYLSDLAKRTYLTVELGLQTIHETTAQKLNRCHSYKEFTDGYNALVSSGINVCIHIINGLPYETREMMLQTADAVSRLHPHSIKIHMLDILSGTALGRQYTENRFPVLSLEEYISIVADQIERMPQDVIIQRITGDPDRNLLIAPAWTANKKAVLNGVDKELAKRSTYQSFRYKPD